MRFSPKQASFIAHSDAFINVADGAVRSGKTHAAMVRFAKFCASAPPGDLCVMGKTERTVRRNVVNPLKELLPGAVRYVQGSGELYVFGRLCWVVGANNIEAEEKVRGMTLAGGFLNEVTLYPHEVFDQAIARSLTIPGARFFADCNPDSPYHWLMENYLQSDFSKDYLKRWRFKLVDNPVLGSEALKRAHAMWRPGTLFYRRNIEGEWVQAEGVIYDMFDERAHVVEEWPERFSKVVVGADYGTATTTAFVMFGLANDGKWYAFREYYWDALKRGRQKTDGEFAQDMKTFLKGWSYPDPYGELYPTSIEIDPSAASFRLELRRQGVRRVKLADNDVLDGIRVVSTALTDGSYFIHASCENLIKEKTSYVWDEKAQMERGEDKPLKQYDHGQDAERYGIMRAIGKKGLSLVATA